MVMRNTLVLLSGDQKGAAAEAALLVSDKSRSQVTGLHLIGDAVLNMPPIVEGMTERQIVQQFAKSRSDAEAAEAQSREMFAAACARHNATLGKGTAPLRGIHAVWETATGRAERVLAEKSRIYDLLVSVGSGDAAGEQILGALETALFDAGRPVMVVPREVPTSLGKHILIGWNRSANAARAVMAAMPFIKTAETVTVCYVTTGAKSGPDAEELAASLAWHDVDVKVQHIPAGGAPISDLLMTEAANTGGDLVVMGAYSHSRMREFVLGGVTRHALRHVVTPLLMMH